MADNTDITLSPEGRVILADIFHRKVQHALSYDSWNKKNLKVTIDIYSEEAVREWAVFLGIRGEFLDLTFNAKKLDCQLSRTFWKKKYTSVEEFPRIGKEWWIRHHGQFRTIVLVKKGAIFDDSRDPGIECSLWGTRVHSFVSRDRADTDIIEGSKREATLYYFSIKFSTRLLRKDDPVELERLYSGEGR